MSALPQVLDLTYSAAGATTAAGVGTIWIDLDNSPHVPFFAPILDELHDRGYSTVVTARDCFQVRELADLHGLSYRLIGRHSGKNRLRKITGLCKRALQLAPTALLEKPDLAVSHGSRAQLIVSTSLGIPSLLIGDYEFSTAWMKLIQPTWVMAPDVIPTSAIRCDPSRILRYPGIKEDVYVPRFVPDPSLRSQLGLDERDVVVTVRPPANEAHYHNPDSDVLFEAAVECLSRIRGVKLVALPRNEKQARRVKARWPDLFSTGQMRIPQHAVDGLNLIWYSDLVISGGGTMNREAAAMGVPVYSVFRGQIGAVDRYLSATGRLVLLERVQDIAARVQVVRRDRPAVPQEEGRAALTSIVTQLTAIVDATRDARCHAAMWSNPGAEPMHEPRSRDPKAVALSLLAYCRSHDWAGYDPYDALNSRLLVALPFLRSRPVQLLLTQALKRSPINIRGVMLVPRTQNPKALALFLSAFLKLAKLGALGDGELVQQMIDRLIDLRSENVPAWCWGYSFPWQTRTIVVPRAAPNLVCTSFVANALLDVYEQHRESSALSMAVSAAEYILSELYWTDGRSAAGFSYPLPSRRSRIHNANFLGAALLCRVYRLTGEKKLLGPALSVVRCSAASQHDDGSWDYGEGPAERWIDNFHTGYNLCALRAVGQSLGTEEFESCLRRGYEFYRAHFFREDGAARYFHDRTYPIDIHCVAQSIITLLALRDLEPTSVRLAHSVFQWAVDHMWDDRGFFYYRVHRLGTIRTSYMRWSQAWMLLAASSLLAASNDAPSRPEARWSTAVVAANTEHVGAR